MTKIQLATRIDKEVKKAVETACRARGLKMNRFIEEALVDKLEVLGAVQGSERGRGGSSGAKKVGSSLDRFVGDWSLEEEAELLDSVEEFSRIEPGFWR